MAFHQTKLTPRDANAYAAVRDHVLRLQPSDVGIAASPELPRVWGVVMDVALGDLTATLVSLADGMTSLYFSNGSGIIGAGEHATVTRARDSLISLAQHFDSKLQPTDDFPLPKRGCARFYLLTFSGVCTAEVSGKDLGETRHELSPLHQKCDDVITAIRTCAESRDPWGAFTFKDNVLQAIIIAACLALGAIIGPRLVEDRLPGILMGGFLGLIVGWLGSGILLMVMRAIRRGRVFRRSKL